ncbi:unnamed protein product [Diabrotica balteata]|uniref:Transcription initiation factor TFIID subunit 6 n=1 Tax=Diabrotica balteata TaxID=107213 RepID=A0A9P0DZG4_DIABA|nr:unnamed protein product [Diabrotica balteata]
MSTSNNVKSKKSSKDREKRKSLPSTSNASDTNTSDKGSSEQDGMQYAGIGPDIIRNYAEQTMHEAHLSDEVCNLLSEDINYKLRYIIHDALLTARLHGDNVISSKDIDESFRNLSIEKVYGATTTPNWVPFSDVPGANSSDQFFYYLDDSLVNLVELAEEEPTYVQHGDIILTKSWFPDSDAENVSEVYQNYFKTACQCLISGDDELREVTLQDISENSKIGPISQWFYNFGYFLLIKNITYDSLTLRALDLIETLENSPIPSSTASHKSLQLLVRLLLQRLLLSYTSPDILKRMCFTLSILCLREPLRQLAISKINQKIDVIGQGAMLPVLTIIYYLGVDAVKAIFLPRITFFLDQILKENGEMIYFILAIYGVICHADLDDQYTHNWFDAIIPSDLVMYWKSFHQQKDDEKIEINFATMKCKLILTRRKIDCTARIIAKPSLEDILNSGDINLLNSYLHNIEEVFTLPTHDCKIRTKIEEHRRNRQVYRKQTHVVIGKTSLLLSVLNSGQKHKRISNCYGHSLMDYIL